MTQAGGGWFFAVCGEREHLDRAAAAAAALRRSTARRVIVLTDPARNRGALAGEEVVSVSTPVELSDAQAAIWLKTSVAEVAAARGFGPGPHAYLDSDVVAVSPEIDRIFDLFVPPVTFVSDLPVAGATLRSFSSHAIVCACAEERERLERHFARLDDLTALHRAHHELAGLADPALYAGARFDGTRRRGTWWQGEATGGNVDGSIAFRQRFEDGHPVKIVYRFAGRSWTLEKTGDRALFRRDPGDDVSGPGGGSTFRFVDAPDELGGGHWEDERGDSLRRYEGEAGPGDETCWWFRAGEPRRRWQIDPASEHGGAWVDSAGAELGVCDHLAERLEALFGVAIADRDWVPWNGGLFLFGDASRRFLAGWRERCLATFAEPDFRTRDQGALVATVWASRLERHPRLPRAWNLLIDRRSPAARELRLGALRADGARLLHLIGGGLDDPEWALARDLAALTGPKR